MRSIFWILIFMFSLNLVSAASVEGVTSVFKDQISIGSVHNVPLYVVLIVWLLAFVAIFLSLGYIRLFKNNNPGKIIFAFGVSMLGALYSPLANTMLNIINFSPIVAGVVVGIIFIGLIILGIGKAHYWASKGIGFISKAKREEKYFRKERILYSHEIGMLEDLREKIKHLPHPKDPRYVSEKDRIRNEILQVKDMVLSAIRIDKQRFKLNKKGDEAKLLNLERQIQVILDETVLNLDRGKVKKAKDKISKALKLLKKELKWLKSLISDEKEQNQEAQQEVKKKEEKDEREEGWYRKGDWEYKKNKDGRWVKRKAGQKGIPGSWVSEEEVRSVFS